MYISKCSGTTADTDCSSQLSDVICLNRYYGWYFGGPDLEVSETGLRKELSDWGKLGKPVMFTEYGADTVSGLHDTTSVMYTEEYQVEYYEMNNKVFDEFDFVVGEQAWNFADFATSQSLLRVQGNKKDCSQETENQRWLLITSVTDGVQFLNLVIRQNKLL